MLARLFKRKLTGDLLFLYASFGANYFFPLVTIPFLTRVLGMSAWGRLIFVQSFFQIVNVILGYGFGYHGTRLVAQHRDDKEHVALIFGRITTARALLIFPAALVAVASAALVPSLRSDLRLSVSAFALSLVSSFGAAWLLLGVDKMRFCSLADFLSRFAATLLIFIFIRRPDQAYLVLVFQALACFVVLAASYYVVNSDFPLRLWAPGNLMATYRQSFGMFAFTLSSAVVNQLSAFLLGLFVGTGEVGMFAAAEKIIRAASSLVAPLASALHSKINYKLSRDPAGAARLFTYGTAALLAGGSLLTVFLWTEARVVVVALLGAKFASSAAVLKVLAFMTPIHWMSYSISMNWFIPRHWDRSLNVCVFFAALVTVVAAWILCPRYSSIGMAWTILLSEAALLLALVCGAAAKGVNPLRVASPS